MRRDGFAVDREEFDENFCCIAAPIFDERGRFVAALGLSTTPHVFDTERERLSTTVMQVAARRAGAPAAAERGAPRPRVARPATEPGVVNLQADAKNPRFLRADAGGNLAS